MNGCVSEKRFRKVKVGLVPRGLPLPNADLGARRVSDVPSSSLDLRLCRLDDLLLHDLLGRFLDDSHRSPLGVIVHTYIFIIS